MHEDGFRIIFVNYGSFGNNSGSHIAALAKGLALRGHTVAVCAEGDREAAQKLLGDEVRSFSLATLLSASEEVATCGPI